MIACCFVRIGVMKVILIGATGMLGADFLALLKGRAEVYAFDSKTCDITSEKSIELALAGLKDCDYLINCAAYTKVDLAESEKKKAYAVNVLGVKNLARFCKENAIVMVHFSTDYVFNGSGDKPWQEDDPVEPLNYYGYSKLQGELALGKVLQESYIFRVQWLYGKNGTNFVETILNKANESSELKIVADQWGAPSWTRDIARAVLSVIEKKEFGTYHLANLGCTNWYEFAKYFLKLKKIQAKIEPVERKMFVKPAKRPLNSRLDLGKYLGLGGVSA